MSEKNTAIRTYVDYTGRRRVITELNPDKHGRRRRIVYYPELHAYLQQTQLNNRWYDNEQILQAIDYRKLEEHPYALSRQRFMQEFMPQEYRELADADKLTDYLIDFEERLLQFKDSVFQAVMKELGADDQMKRNDWGKYHTCLDTAAAEAETEMNMKMLHSTDL